MKLAIVLMIASTLGAQTLKYCTGGEQPNNDPDCIPASASVLSSNAPFSTGTLITGSSAGPAPLTCPKYQHVEFRNNYEQVCADDLHTVTEREWQAMADWRKAVADALRAMQTVNDLKQQQNRELLERLKKLEAK